MPDLDAAMRIYLGADDSGGITPLDGERRLREAYGVASTELKAKLDEYLSVMMTWEPNWKTETLTMAAERIEREVAERMPEFSSVTRRAMANFFAFQWR